MMLALPRAWSLVSAHVCRGVEAALKNGDVDFGLADALAASEEHAVAIQWKINADRREARWRAERQAMGLE